MRLKSKKASSFILGITALFLSRIMFALFDDPEGPNLLVVFGMAFVTYILSFLLLKIKPKRRNRRRNFYTAFSVQVLVTVILYFLLR